jgi:hypothetical protein
VHLVGFYSILSLMMHGAMNVNTMIVCKVNEAMLQLHRNYCNSVVPILTRLQGSHVDIGGAADSL